MDNFWSICLGRFQQELSAQQFNTWIKPLQFEAHNGAWRLLAPNRFVMQWVKDRFLDRIKLIAEEVVNHPIEIELAVSAKPDNSKLENGHNDHHDPLNTAEPLMPLKTVTIKMVQTKLLYMMQ
jgi:chromosomal replication initiator protein